MSGGPQTLVERVSGTARGLRSSTQPCNTKSMGLDFLFKGTGRVPVSTSQHLPRGYGTGGWCVSVRNRGWVVRAYTTKGFVTSPF